MQAKDQDDRLSLMPISAQPGASPPSPSKNENILKTKVFLTFINSRTGLSAHRASAGKAGNLADVAKKAGIANKAGISFCPKIVDLSLNN
jgi:hypothetical protein